MEVHINLVYRWFCRLGLDGKVADHSIFSKSRHGRFRQSDILRHLFENGYRRLRATSTYTLRQGAGQITA